MYKFFKENSLINHYYYYIKESIYAQFFTKQRATYRRKIWQWQGRKWKK